MLKRAWLVALLAACGNAEKPTDTASSEDTASSDDIDGGDCTYDSYPGTCTGEGEGLFTYAGDVNGEAVSAAGNPLSSLESLGADETTACTLQFITTGSCTPCLLDIGSCGDEAWDVFRAQ